MLAIDGGSFKIMVDSTLYDKFIKDALAEQSEHFLGDIRLTIAVVGVHGVTDSKVRPFISIKINYYLDQFIKFDSV